MLKATRCGYPVQAGTGFQLMFKNGYTVSVQWHSGSYVTDRAGKDSSQDAEVAVWNSAGKWLRLSKYDDVIGYQDSDSVARLLAKVQAIDPANPLTEMLEW